jgi:serine/threonine-protein kinase
MDDSDAGLLATIGAGADTLATIAASPGSTIVPTIAQSTQSGARLSEELAELAQNPLQIEVAERLGEGGMGVVNAATQTALGRTVAVKTLKRSDPAGALDLLREAWVTGSLEHPSIVPVHYLTVTPDGTPSIVLKRIEGVEWSRLLGDAAEVKRRFGSDDLLAWNIGILTQVLNAVRFAHSHGILHRDLKPANVMIGDYGEVYLLDWGIAVSLRDDGTGRLPLAANANQLAGTPSYMAPEMLRRETDPPLSERTDVYLAGAVLFEIVAGGPPHRGTSSLAVIASIVASQPELPAGVPAELARIVDRALEREPAARFESIEALQAALQRYVAHRGSAQLAMRADERLAELKTKLAANATQTEIYRLFGACRYGFRDALAVWPDNEDARRGLVQAIVAVAEFELAANRADIAVQLLEELEEPHPMQERAREQARASALRVAELERIGRDHDQRIGTRTRMVIALFFGILFTALPLAFHSVDMATQATHDMQISFACGFLVLILIARWWARETMGATAFNRRMSASLIFLFIAQIMFGVGAKLVGVPAQDLWVWNFALYFVVAGLSAISLEPWLWVVAAGYLAAFLASAYDRTHVLLMLSAANALFTVVAVWRWRTPLTVRRPSGT